VKRLCRKRSRVGKIFVMLLKKVVFLGLRVCFRFEVTGRQKIPKQGPSLICPNHQSFLDPLFLYALLPDETLYIANGESFRRPPLSWIVHFSRLLLTGRRGGSMPQCLKLAYEGLHQGMIVCVFPEGTRSNTHGLMEPRLGSGILSCEADAPILPVLIHGATGVLSPVHPGFHFYKIKVEIGDPIFPETASPENYQLILESWKHAIVQMQTEVSGSC
jgi:1-acyl-sn-glycerol-3-phosphate acyltransferase